MFKPPDFHPNSNSYSDLQSRILHHIQAARVDDQILTVVEKAYEKALLAENLVLSRAEKKRLLAQILKAVLEAMSKQLTQGSASV